MKKNVYSIKLFILVLSIALFSNNLIASQRRAAGKRPMNYSGPRNARQIPAPPTIAPPIENEQMPSRQQEITPEELEEIQNTAQPPTETQRVSDIKEAQIDKPALGFFASMYLSIAPVILGTLDKALGLGTLAGTKSLIKLSMNRNAFLNIKSDVEDKAIKIVDSGEFERKTESAVQKTMQKIQMLNANQEDKEELMQDIIQKANHQINLPRQQKIDIIKNDLFAENEIKDPKKMEKQTSVSYIFAQAASTFVINTAVNTLATLFGYGTKMALIALMPDQK